MKKYLFIALAALVFAACAEKVDDTNVPKGELEESYIAINLMAADVDTRAPGDPLFPNETYEQGTDAERAIKTAYFFFFDAEGDAFNVTGAPATAPGNVDGVNHMSLTISNATTSGMPNVSDIKNAVLILNTYKGVYPSKIVAVLNWKPQDDKAYTLAELHEVIDNSIGNDTQGYVMSNSVYMDGAGNVVDAVPLTAANIKTTADEATKNPIDIYVERTAAKVVLTASGKVTDENIFETQKTSDLVGSNEGILAGAPNPIDVYVKLHGWELYNEYSTSTLLKNIENWDVTTLGLTWNDIPYYRCYWAQSQGPLSGDSFAWSYANQADKGFPTSYGFKIANIATDYASDTYTYCGENTNQKDGSTDPRTKVILKGQLMQKNGEKYQPLELARWYGTEYAGNEALRIAVANSLKHTVFSSADQTQYDPITPGDLEYVAGETVGAKAYEVGFQLSTAGEGKTWYKYSSEKGYEILGGDAANKDKIKEATNAHLKTVEPALLYAQGNTYYIVDIEHLGTAGAKFGVVRNHVYQIDINSITGYGSPIYNGLSFIVDQPEYPIEDEGSFVAAKINVLSWKVVKQGVNVGQ